MPDPVIAHIYSTLMERAVDLFRIALLENGHTASEKDIENCAPILSIGVTAAAEYFAAHPEHLPLAASPNCTICQAPIQTLQVGLNPTNTAAGSVRIAWPCGHIQK